MKTRKRKPPVLFKHSLLAETIKETLEDELKNVTPSSPEDWTYFLEHQKTLKKYPPTTHQGAQDRRRSAIKKFVAVQKHLCAVNLDLPPDGFSLSRCSWTSETRRWQDLLRARAIVYEILGDVNYDDIFSLCKHGPNTSQGVGFYNSGNSAKWNFPITGSDEIVELFGYYLHWDLTLANALRVVHPTIPIRDLCWWAVEISNCSVLTTVPKNDEIDRTIAIEPTLNMFFQQGIGLAIAEKLRPFGIDLSKQQDLHRKMAFEASVRRHLATIDFSSASDCVSTELLKFLLPPSWFRLVERVRCRTVNVPGVGELDLSCIATMGNATTFALETLVFYALGLSSIHPLSRSSLPDWELKSYVSVFGDDCLIPTAYAIRFMDLCASVGFLVNEQKTHYKVEDKFRESCGADFFSGRNVRPLYLSGPRNEKPSTLRAWLYTVWNITSKRLMLSLGELRYVYSPTLQYLASVISEHNTILYVVPATETDDCGLKLWGDGVRLRRLFTAPFSPILCDKHGLQAYRKLVTPPPPAGFQIEVLEFWLRLKFPRHIDPFSPDSESKSFTVRKVSGGYVVGIGRTTVNFLGLLDSCP